MASSARRCFYTGAGATGTIAQIVYDLSSGGSKVETFASLPSGALDEYQTYSGPDGTGTNTSTTYDLTSGGTITNIGGGSSTDVLTTNLPSGVVSETLSYTGADATGTITQIVYDLSSGGSEVETLYWSAGRRSQPIPGL